MTRRGTVSIVAAGMLVVCAMAWPIAYGLAQDSLIMDILREQQPPRQQQPIRQQPAGPATRLPGDTVAATPIPLRRTYCVRTCDGYYFSIGFVRDNEALADQETMCAASCGTAEMKLYTAELTAVTQSTGDTGLAVERAVDATGAAYTALPNAFRFRDGDQKSCACLSTASGLPQVPIELDSTLRPGDIVVMSDGLKVFRGQREAPHQERDFVGVARSQAISAEVRRQLMTLETRIQE